jgi:hypothetical protein
MNFPRPITALALLAFSGLALGQTTPQPTYYPQCWFWQLPANT